MSSAGIYDGIHEDSLVLPYQNDYYKRKKETGRRHFPGGEFETWKEWSFYPEGYHCGKRCLIEGFRRGNCQTSREITLTSVIGRCRKVVNRRDGLPVISDGDKSYTVPEYSENFHKIGSTLPAINFSRSSKLVSDTFIPLQPLEKSTRPAYNDRSREQLEKIEKNEVILLSKWKPSPTLKPSL